MTETLLTDRERSAQRDGWAMALTMPVVAAVGDGAPNVVAWRALRASLPTLRQWLRTHCGWDIGVLPHSRGLRILRDAASCELAGLRVDSMNGMSPLALECVLRLLATADRCGARQFALGDVADWITDESASRPGGALRWVERRERSALVQAVHWLTELHALTPFDDTITELERFEKSDRTEVTAPLLKWTDAATLWRLQPALDITPPSPRMRAWRWLLTVPTLHRTDDPVAFAEAVAHAADIEDIALAAFGWSLEVTQHSIALVRDSDDDLPARALGARPHMMSGVHQLLCLCCTAWRDSVGDGTLPLTDSGEIVLDRTVARGHILAVRERFEDWLPSTVVTRGVGALLDAVAWEAAHWGILRVVDDETWAITESAARVPGAFLGGDVAPPSSPRLTLTGVLPLERQPARDSTGQPDSLDTEHSASGLTSSAYLA